MTTRVPLQSHLLPATLALLTACGTVAPSTASLVAMDALEPGEACAAGGVAVRTGVDDDGDGTLSSAETDATTNVCNGSAGSAAPNGAVLRVTEVAAGDTGSDCAAGGTRVETGIDDDGDGVLDDAEVDQDSVVCNGTDGGGDENPTTPGGVLYGDYEIRNSLDAELIDRIEEITGTLWIDGNGLTEVSLPTLRRVGGSIIAQNAWNGGTLTHLNLPALETVEGGLAVEGEAVEVVSAPMLRDVGSISVREGTSWATEVDTSGTIYTFSVPAIRLELPLLETVENSVVLSGPFSTFTLDRLTTVGDTIQLDVEVAFTIALPALETARSIRISSWSAHEIGDFTELTHIDWIHISGASLTHIGDFDSLIDVATCNVLPARPWESCDGQPDPIRTDTATGTDTEVGSDAPNCDDVLAHGPWVSLDGPAMAHPAAFPSLVRVSNLTVGGGVPMPDMPSADSLCRVQLQYTAATPTFSAVLAAATRELRVFDPTAPLSLDLSAMSGLSRLSIDGVPERSVINDLVLPETTMPALRGLSLVSLQLPATVTWPQWTPQLAEFDMRYVSGVRTIDGFSDTANVELTVRGSDDLTTLGGFADANTLRLTVTDNPALTSMTAAMHATELRWSEIYGNSSLCAAQTDRFAALGAYVSDNGPC